MNQEVTLIIEGMTCASCSAAVERVTGKLPGVESSQVNLATNRARIVYDPEQVTVEMLCERIERAGFGAKEEQKAAALNQEITLNIRIIKQQIFCRIQKNIRLIKPIIFKKFFRFLIILCYYQTVFV